MLKRLSVLLLVCSFALAAAAMEPDPATKQLDIFDRNYDCQGITYASPMAPEHPTQATVTASRTLGGHWVRFNYVEKKTAQNPMPFVVEGYFGIDPQKKNLILGGVDNMGGYTTASSDGWNGDTLVFTGPWHMGDRVVTGRDTFMKKSATEMTHMAEIEMDGKWVPLSRETCTAKK